MKKYHLQKKVIFNFYVLLFFLIKTDFSFSKEVDTAGLNLYEEEIRPTHLLNFETGSTLLPGRFVVSALGSSARLALGALPNLETRVDFSFLSYSGQQNSFGVIVAGKYHLLQSGAMNLAIEANVGPQKTITGTPRSGVSGRIPFSVGLGSALLTVVPGVSRQLVSQADNQGSLEMGLAVPIFSFVDGIAESSTLIQSGTTQYGYHLGIVLKPSNQITLPIVFASKQPGEQSGFGLVGFFAHVGLAF